MEDLKKIKVKGTATINADNSFEFAPYNEGQPVQRDVKTSGRSKLYRTEGEKQKSLVAHLVADANSPDIAASLFDDLNSLTRDMPSAQPKLPRGRRLLDNTDLQVVLSAEGALTIQYQCTSPPDSIAAHLVDMSYRVQRCVALNAKVITAALKRSVNKQKQQKKSDNV